MKVSEITVQEFATLRKKNENFFLLDVRNPEEYEIANLGGYLIPLHELPARLNELDKNAHIVIHCRSGARSHHAAEFLMEHGFKNVQNLHGGIVAWQMEIEPK